MHYDDWISRNDTWNGGCYAENKSTGAAGTGRKS